MEQFANAAQSTLNGAINAAVASLTVTSATAFPTSGTFRLIIDSEILIVTAVAANVFTVTRGAEGTSAAVHANGAAVTCIVTAGALEQLKTDAGGGSSAGKTVQAMADANQTLSADDSRKGLIKTTGALTAKRTLTLDVPASEGVAYPAVVLNTCAGYAIDVSVGTGNKIEIEPGAKAMVQATTTGVEIVLDLPLDPRDFGCPWNGVDDDLPGLDALLAAIPTTRDRRTVIQLPKGMGYCSDNLRVNRNVDIVGHGRGYIGGGSVHNGIKFPPLRGVIFDGHATSSTYPDSSADGARIRRVSITSTQAVVTDAGGNIGLSNYFLDATLDIWSALPTTVILGTVVIKSGVTVGSIADYYNDGAARDASILVMFRCTTGGTKGSAEPGAFATAGLAELGDTITATSGTAVWTVESVPKDYVNQTAYVAGQRVFIPGDTDHVLECEVAGTSCGWSTTIAAGSDAAVLPQATINVDDASTFPASGMARVTTSLGPEVVTYTGTTGTTLTGCTGGTGTMSTSGEVTAPFTYRNWGVAPRVPASSVTPSYRAVFYDRSTTITAGSDAAVLPQATINVTNTDDLAASGTVYVWTGAAYEAVTYTGKTTTTLTGCSGGTGTMNTGDAVGQGARWKQIPSAAVTILANWVEVEDCSIFGATGNAVWIQANADPSAANGSPFAGGSNFWAVRNCIFGWCGSGLTTNSNNTNGGESCNIQHLFLGGGRTWVDEADYLNIPEGKWGSGAAAVKDRTQGNNKHRNHYIQFSSGMPFRNDLFTNVPAEIPGGNYSQWDYVPSETAHLPVFLYPAVVTGATGGVGSGTSASIIGAQSQNLRVNCALISDSTKSLQATVGPQNTGAASCFSISHSDDSYEIGFGITDDQAYYPTKWWTWGQANGPGFYDGQVFLFPRTGSAGATFPSGGAAPKNAFWINGYRFWIGGSPNVDPHSIGFDAAAPTTGFFVEGSLTWNSAPAVGLPIGWQCTAGGSPGTWVALDYKQGGGGTVWVAAGSQAASAFSTSNIDYVPCGPAADDTIEFQMVAPYTGTMSLSVLYAMSAAEANDIRLRLDVVKLVIGDNPTTALTTGTPFTVTPGNHVTLLQVDNVDSADFNVAIVKGAILKFKFTRIGTDGADTHTGDMRVIEIRVQ